VIVAGPRGSALDVTIAGPGIAGPLCGFGSGSWRGTFGRLPRGIPRGLPRGPVRGTFGGAGRVPSAIALPGVVVVLVETEAELFPLGFLLGLVLRWKTSHVIGAAVGLVIIGLIPRALALVEGIGPLMVVRRGGVFAIVELAIRGAARHRGGGGSPECDGREQ